ncbi:hypothetical protein B0H99_101363 [Planomicrobium soli]|uniref:Uncharacterized protein n=1 Tax=Planomicrobium soli TaxID=1176648 RepID=A0A2P8H7A1_9BACL|nr:hypothetical protein [Planomicrobium soli]PSL42115.1 hypothetical protein B0H99_101363 [Planomicrobium soli]
MKRFPTVGEAKKEIESLQSFIMLAEAYPEETIEQQIIKLYAYTGSIKEVVSEINIERTKQQLELIDNTFVSEVIQSKPADPLHKLLRSNYMSKTKHNRKKNPDKGQRMYI